MKKVIITVMSFIILSTAVLLASCSGKTNNAANTSGSSTNSSSSNKTFTAVELKKYNGQNGNPAYVVVNGTVYDVTNAKRWNNGVHENGVVAGVDLTSALPNSPHGDSVLKDLPVVGKLK